MALIEYPCSEGLAAVRGDLSSVDNSFSPSLKRLRCVLWLRALVSDSWLRAGGVASLSTSWTSNSVTRLAFSDGTTSGLSATQASWSSSSLSPSFRIRSKDSDSWLSSFGGVSSTGLLALRAWKKWLGATPAPLTTLNPISGTSPWSPMNFSPPPGFSKTTLSRSSSSPWFAASPSLLLFSKMVSVKTALIVEPKAGDPRTISS